MSYVNSSAIRVFPSVRRTYGQAFARQTTEGNLVSMINKLIDNDGFVATKLVGGEANNTDFSFCIYGYYFSSTLGTIVGSFTTDVYATITIDPNSSHPEFNELIGVDADNVYKGIDFTATAQTGTNKHCLHLLHKTGNNWLVPEASQLKFSLDSINISLIDGGVI